MLQGKGILTNLQKEILSLFSQVPDAVQFFLTGDTALSEFYLKDRLSYDLDFFTSQDGLIESFSEKLSESLKEKGFEVQATRRFQTFAEFKLGKVKEKTTVHLAYDSPFRFFPPVDSVFEVKINDYKDIIVDKLLAFFGRSEPRDAVDLFFIWKKEDIWDLADLARQKDPGFDLYWLAVASEKVKKFPDEISQWPADMLVEVSVSELKSKFGDLTREIMARIKKDPSA